MNKLFLLLLILSVQFAYATGSDNCVNSLLSLVSRTSLPPIDLRLTPGQIEQLMADSPQFTPRRSSIESAIVSYLDNLRYKTKSKKLSRILSNMRMEFTNGIVNFNPASSPRSYFFSHLKRNDRELIDVIWPYPDDLTYAEAYGLFHYSAEEYAVVNSYLRTDRSRESYSLQLMTLLVQSALSKLRGESFEYTQVYRGTSLGRSILDRYRVGQIMNRNSFTSTSLDREIAHKFATEESYGNVFFTIQTWSGVEISNFSALADEELEVLIPVTARFEVVSRSKSSEDITLIELRELPAH